MSGNHNQSLDRALEIVDAAASAGAALKIQTYTPDTMTINLNEEFILVMRIVFGKANLYMIFMERLIHHGMARKNF